MNSKILSVLWRFAVTMGAAIAGVFCALSAAPAAEPLLEKIELFEAGKDGYALYRIPGVVVTAKGTVLAYCEARRTGKSDWDTIDIMLRRSTDGGKRGSRSRKSPMCRGQRPKTRWRWPKSSPILTM